MRSNRRIAAGRIATLTLLAALSLVEGPGVVARPRDAAPVRKRFNHNLAATWQGTGSSLSAPDADRDVNGLRPGRGTGTRTKVPARIEFPNIVFIKGFESHTRPHQDGVVTARRPAVRR